MSADLRDQLTKRYEDISKLISAIEQKMSKYPNGRIRIKNQNNKPYFYWVENESDRSGKLLKNDDTALIGDLVQKSYFQKVLKSAQDEQRTLKKALDSYPDIPVEKIFDTVTDERKRFIKPIITPDDEFIKQWLGQTYEIKPFAEGTPYYETLKGERVRSKSEQIIADRLTAAAVPYKYECPLKIGNTLYHPDFKILRISDRKEIYYEHFGKMGDPAYVNNNMLPRFNTYQQNGIILGENFFATFESSEHPLDVRVLDKLIEDHFR